MKQHHLRLLLLSLAVGGSSSAFAQSDLSYIFTARPKYTFSAALKIRTGGAAVKFGNLGTVPAYPSIGYKVDDKGNPVLENGKLVPSGAYIFQDGTVSVDQKRLDETKAGPTPVTAGAVTTTTTTTPTLSADGTRYQTTRLEEIEDKTDPNNIKKTTVTTTTGDFLAYQAGATRSWSYEDARQVVNGAIEMHGYGAVSNGASKEAEGGGSSGGFDLQLSRELGQIGKKGQWGFAFSLGVNDINAKASGQINTTLLTQTARFSLFGQAAPTAPYAGPTTTDFIQTVNGVPATTPIQATETTVPIAAIGTVSDPVASGTATVDGKWKIKGAYYMTRLGPSFRYQFTKRLSLSGNAGLGVGYVGSVYTVTESLNLPAGVPNRKSTDQNGVVTPLSAPTISDEVRSQAVKLGYYGEVNVEFWMTYRTGLFAGVVYEHLGKYSQRLRGRTADVDIGSGTAFRIGIINRF